MATQKTMPSAIWLMVTTPSVLTNSALIRSTFRYQKNSADLKKASGSLSESPNRFGPGGFSSWGLIDLVNSSASGEQQSILFCHKQPGTVA
ncbi:MAG: hypothetical protein ACNYPE_03465 [Candidatus Azotimanducaceae bacterium WSBS_2022_MAG_OTU7]